MPSTSDSDRANHLENLDLKQSRATRLDFDAGGGLSLVVEPHAPGVFRLRCGLPAQVAEDRLPGIRAKAIADMLLARQEAVGELLVEPQAGGAHRGWRVVQGDTALEISVDPVHVALYRNGTCVLASDISQDVPAFAWEGEPPEYWTVGFALDKTEPIYGLGETAGDLNRRDETVVSDDPAHRALPLAWSPRGWGVYVNTVRRVEHALGAAEAPSSYMLNIDDPVLDLFLFAGEPCDILNQYSALTGRAGQPVLWAMGAWLEQPAGQTVTQTAELVAQARQAKVPLDVVLLAPPAAWRPQDAKLTLEWDAGRFPDAKQAMALLRRHDTHVCAPVLPGVAADTPAFAELEDRGWLLAGEDGSARVFDGVPATGGKPYGLLDLTHRDVYALWVERNHHIFEDGVGAPACSVQIDLPDDIAARGGESGAALRTIYPLLARRALFDAVAGHKTPPEGVVYGTDLFPAAQRLPWQAGPRVPNTWEGLAQTLRTALALGASGVPVQMHGLGNAQAPLDTMTPELYLRWLAAAVFSGNFVFQGVPQLMPWAFDEATQAHARTWLQWRYRLIPYVLGAVEDAVRTGLPVQRSMALSYPADTDAHAFDTQYLLGPALLVAPVLQPGGKVGVYLPKGDAWWDLNTGWRYEGGTLLQYECGYDRYPVFGREGHMLCLGPAGQHTGEFNSARILDEVWMFGMPVHNPAVMRNKIRVMQMQGSSYIKGLEGLRILPSEGLEVKRRGAEVRISRAR
ncbi:glycoside hydrolase family 31 protein [Orrella sp. JC864]|uniref:glycoside hydrolase family 31 protein n=1 Tax=Orrella sp. JC864 TaxID=3120298 RepID=UPI00300AEA40